MLEGKKLGRPMGILGSSKFDSKIEEIKRLLGLGISKASIAMMIGVEHKFKKTGVRFVNWFFIWVIESRFFLSLYQIRKSIR